jgi:hypothetical protein
MEPIIVQALEYADNDTLLNLSLSSRTAYDVARSRLVAVGQISRTRRAHSECMWLVVKHFMYVCDDDPNESRRTMIRDSTVHCKSNYYGTKANIYRHKCLADDTHFTYWTTVTDVKMEVTNYDETEAEYKLALKGPLPITNDVQKIIIAEYKRVWNLFDKLKHSYALKEVMVETQLVAAYYDERRNREQVRDL